MALSLTLSAVSAEDAADTLAADDEAIAVEGQAAGEAVAATGTSDVPSADVETDVEKLDENPYEIVWGVAVTNKGPDTAESIIVAVDGGDNLLLYDYIATAGVYYPEQGLWLINELPVNQTAKLLLDTIKIDKGPYYVEALAVTIGSADHNLANNYDIAWADVPVSAAEETMPAAGNPIAMALLALISIAGATFARRF